MGKLEHSKPLAKMCTLFMKFQTVVLKLDQHGVDTVPDQLI